MINFTYREPQPKFWKRNAMLIESGPLLILRVETRRAQVAWQVLANHRTYNWNLCVPCQDF